jgi:hypothetical protein
MRETRKLCNDDDDSGVDGNDQLLILEFLRQ